MTTNIYANKVYKEGPSALWTLDDDLSVTPVSLPASINLSGLYGIEADLYGFDSGSGYYISTTNSASDVLAFNDAIPLVFGAPNSTTIYSGDGTPALIVPGKGFMHDYGKNKNVTVEFWTKIISNENTSEKRIFGPINSTDGLYVSGPFLTLKVADSVGSHYVGQWGRPMLINICYTDEKVSLMVNGAPVLLLEFDIDYTSFSSLPEDNWLGFYAYDSVPVINLDCIAIYPYNVSSRQAKLHFVFGQATEEPESKNTEISDLPVIIDYQMSKTAGNHNYPDHSVWSDGYMRNLSINNRHLCAPNIERPEISFDSETTFQSDWRYANKINNEILDPSQQHVFFRLKPENYDEEASGGTQLLGTYWTEDAHIFVEGFKIGSRRADAVYLTGIADRFIDDQTERILDIVDSLDNRFSIVIEYPASGGLSANIKYYFNGTSLKTVTVTESDIFSIGINVTQLLDTTTNEELEEFFSNAEDLSVFFGGSYDYSSTFSGRVYSFGFLSQLDIAAVEELEAITSGNSMFTSGLLDVDILSLENFIAGFTAKATITFDVYDIDVSSVGYWSDIIPLKVLSKDVDNDYIVDYLQLNIDFPEFSNTANSVIRSYVSFIDIDTGQTMSTNLTDVAIPANGVISTSSWATQRYEFVDGNIVIVPPAGSVDSELSLKIEFEVQNKDMFRNPIKIRRLEIASHAFSDTQEIGTKSGKDIFPTGSNCFVRLYKGSNPYFYLSQDSGIKLIDSSNTYNGTSHIKSYLNESFSTSYYISAIQFAFLSDFSFANGTEYNLSRIVMPGNINYDITITGLSSGKGQIAIDDVSPNEATILINGKDTNIVRPNEWNVVTIGFIIPLNFGNSDPLIETSIRFTGNFSYNNLSVYQIAEQKLSQQTIYYPWNTYDNEKIWEDVDGIGALSDIPWSEIAIEALVFGGNIALDPQKIYLDYIGSLRISNTIGGKSLGLTSTKWASYTGYKEFRSTYIPL